MLSDIFKDCKDRMHKGIESLKRDMVTIRTGRANVSILDDVKVEYYGSFMPLNQMATISTPDARLITIQPWDKSALEAIEQAILKSDLGLTPNNDGNIIRLPIPALTEERRKEMVKQARKKGEEARVVIRNIRREANDMIKEFEKEGDVSKDDSARGQEEVQRITDQFGKQIDEILEHKEKEILEV